MVRRYNYNTGETDGFLIITAGTNDTLQYHLVGMENRENKKSRIETYRDAGMDEALEQWLADYMEGRIREIEAKTVSDGNYQLIDGSSDYLLEVSLIEGEKLHPLLQYLLIAEKEYTFRQADINSLWVFN